MSKIALTPNASGTGTLTIAAPNTSTDRTLTLPDSTGTVDTLQRAGNVLQVLSASATGSTATTTSSSSSINSNSYASTGLSVSITPVYSSSKVFLTSNFGWSCNTADFGYYAFGVNGTADTTTAITCFNQSSTNATNSLYYSSISYLYSPGTTSTQTYTLQFRCGAAPTQTMYFNQRGVGGASGLCTITAMEIAA